MNATFQVCFLHQELKRKWCNSLVFLLHLTLCKMSSHTFLPLNYAKALDVIIPTFLSMKLELREIICLRSQDTETHYHEHRGRHSRWSKAETQTQIILLPNPRGLLVTPYMDSWFRWLLECTELSLKAIPWSSLGPGTRTGWVTICWLNVLE